MNGRECAFNREPGDYSFPVLNASWTMAILGHGFFFFFFSYGTRIVGHSRIFIFIFFLGHGTRRLIKKIKQKKYIYKNKIKAN